MKFLLDVGDLWASYLELLAASDTNSIRG